MRAASVEKVTAGSDFNRDFNRRKDYTVSSFTTYLGDALISTSLLKQKII